MGTTSGWASARIAENTKATLCIDAELAGRESSLTAKSCKFHSQLAIARANPRSRRSGSAAASSLIAAVTRWRRASYSRASSRFKTGTPIARNNRAIGGTSSAPRGSVRSNVKRSSSRSGSRCNNRGSTGSNARFASAASASKSQRSCATSRLPSAAIWSCSLSRGAFSRLVRIASNPP